jgi:hypothetical protein
MRSLAHPVTQNRGVVGGLDIGELRIGVEIVEVTFDSIDDGVRLPVAPDLAAAAPTGTVGGAGAALIHQRDIMRWVPLPMAVVKSDPLSEPPAFAPT